MGERIFQVGSVGQDSLFFEYFFFLSGGKMTPPKKKKRISKKSDILLRIFLLNIVSYFQKFSASFS